MESYNEIVFPEPAEGFFARVLNHPAVVVPRLPAGFVLPTPGKASCLFLFGVWVGVGGGCKFLLVKKSMWLSLVFELLQCQLIACMGRGEVIPRIILSVTGL